MKHYFVSLYLTASIETEHHKKGSFYPNPNIKFSMNTAKNQYLKHLKDAIKVLENEIKEVESTDKEYYGLSFIEKE
ncbi:hypothetical protein [Psychrobacter sp. I-STPA6b]|uniref:hypothetical protein n=1 Tax=Psychrobacter sp. I-STPA6b TaxID=2585718 RepID=UPI001D0CC1D7|nr:hypothetical protein [Psychrobacter sp. I-STPA6b]